MPSFLQSLDAFRTIPREFTESTFHGGCLSLIAFFAVALLCGHEIAAFLTTTTTSTVLLDSNFRDTVKITFNITMLDMPCKFTTVNILDELGDRRLNVTNNIQKKIMHWHGDTLVGGNVHEDEDIETEEVEVIDRFAEVDSEGHHSLLISSEDEFNKDLQNHHMVFVNFFAPWCHWCQRLKPVWEETAKEFDGIKFRHGNLNVKFVSVDCDKFQRLCAKHNVRAFPSLLRFKGTDAIHPFFQGSRVKEEIITFFREAIDEYEGHMANLYKYEACEVSGWVEVSRVPGNFYIEGKNPPGQNLSPSMTNVSHIVNHFQFGQTAPSFIETLLPAKHVALMKPLNGREFVSDKMHAAPHHYLKVVSVNFGDVSRFWKTPFYELTSQNRIAVYKEEETPQAKFSFDLSPLAITVGQKSEHWYDFLTGLLGILGGTFTVIRLINGGVLFTKEKVKNAMGKQD